MVSSSLILPYQIGGPIYSASPLQPSSYAYANNIPAEAETRQQQARKHSVQSYNSQSPK